jgi:hypothetical protein
MIGSSGVRAGRGDEAAADMALDATRRSPGGMMAALSPFASGPVAVDGSAVPSEPSVPPSRWGVVAALMTFGVQLLQVRWWSSRLPIGDEWQTMKIFGRAAAGGVRPGMLWEQHNEHRIVIANAVFLTVRRIGGWVVLAPHIISALMMAGMIGVLVSTLLRLEVRPVLVAIAAGFAVTPLQWENTIWGFQVQFVALVAGLVVTLCAVAARPRLDRTTAVTLIAGGLWCSGTIASGVLAWGVFAGLALALAVLRRSAWPQRRAIAMSAGLAALGTVVVVTYRIGYVTPGRPGGGDLGNRLRWTGRALVFPFSGFGGRSPADASLPLGVVAGAVIGALMICVLMMGTGRLWADRSDARSLGRLLLVSGLVAWVLVNIVLIGMARAQEGEIVSRYASLFVWVAVAAVVAADTLLTRAGRPGHRRAGGLMRALPGMTVAVLALAVAQHAGLVRGVPATARHWASKGTLETTVAFLRRGSTGDVAFPNPYANERVFGELLREAQAKDWIGQLPDEVLARLRWAPEPVEGSAWTDGGIYPGSGVPAGLWASWSGADANTGVLMSQPFVVREARVRVGVWTAPEAPGNSLALVDASDPLELLATFRGPPPGDGRAVWEAETAGLRGRRVVLRAVDGASGHRGWFAVEPPVQPSRLSIVVDRVIASSPGIVVTGFGVAVIAALAPPAGGRRRRPDPPS